MMSLSSLLKIIFTLSLTLAITACDNKVNFSSGSSDSPSNSPQQISPVVEPPAPTPPAVVEPPPADPVYESAKGHCSSDSSTAVVSCLTCDVPMVAPPPPQLSRKGRELLEAVHSQCQVKNKTDSKGYVPPSKEELLDRLQQCSPTLYPDTAFQASEENTISRLMAQEPWLIKKMFSGLYYQPPYSDDFASYFGLEVGEARHMFCYGEMAGVSGQMYPIEYWQSEDRFSFVMPPRWAKANQIRETLIRCMQESLTTPYVPPTPDPGYECDFETMKGPSGPKIREKIAKLLRDGYKVGFENSNQGICGQVVSEEDLNHTDGDIKIGAFRCNKKAKNKNK